MNFQASIIVDALLKESKLYTRANSFTLTEAVPLNNLMKRLSDQPVLKENSVKDYLTILEQEEYKARYFLTFRIVKASSSLGRNLAGSYSVNLKLLIHRLQHKTLEKIVEEKIGEYEARIMRALDRLGFLDEKQVPYRFII